MSLQYRCRDAQQSGIHHIEDAGTIETTGLLVLTIAIAIAIAGIARWCADPTPCAMEPSTDEDLNPEPSQPADRKESHLPPKSYAAATEENLDVQVQKENVNGDVKTVTSTSVQSNGQGKDDAPQSSGQTTPTQYVGRGRDDAPRSPAPKSHRKPKSNGTLRTNGYKKEEEQQNLVEEKYKDKDGERLTSIKPTTDYETALMQDEKELPVVKMNDNQVLVSGRQAGAGWERSGYTTPYQSLHQVYC